MSYLQASVDLEEVPTDVEFLLDLIENSIVVYGESIVEKMTGYDANRDIRAVWFTRHGHITAHCRVEARSISIDTWGDNQSNFPYTLIDKIAEILGDKPGVESTILKRIRVTS